MNVLKKIGNWTFGSVFRTFGRVIAYLVIGILLAIICSKANIKLPKLLGIETVSAATVSYDSVKYRLFWYEYDGDDWIQNNNSYTNAGTSTNVQYKGIWAWNTAIALSNTTLVAGRTYKITMTYTLQPANSQLYQNYRTWIYWDNPVGSGNSSGSNASEDNIDRFSATWQPNCETCARNSVVYYITPAVDLKYIQFRLRIRPNNMAITGYDPQLGFTTVNQPAGDYIKITYTTDESALAIQEQTTIIEDYSQQIIDINNQTYDAMTSYSDDATSSSCGIICKLKHIWTYLQPNSLINIIIPTQTQLNDLFTQFQTDLTTKLGILGLPVSVYTNIMHLVDNTPNEGNWCIEWEDVEVPNFEEYTIIEGGSWCYSQLTQNQKINALREFSLYFTGALILLGFLQYCKNIYHRVLDVPVQEDYVYFTEEDVFTYDNITGEVTGAQHKSRKTHKEVAK